MLIVRIFREYRLIIDILDNYQNTRRDVEKAVEMTQLNHRTEVFVEFCECLIKGTLFFIYCPAHIGRSALFVMLVATVDVDVMCCAVS